MNRENYIDICEIMATGKEAFVRNISSGEEGRVESCTREHILVKTREGKEKVWDYHECDKVRGSFH
ncbi:MAG: hypothetical protein R2940_14620 [Syntrophotaleaceae bacterium]